jgi:cell cycle protein kinase DBF2
MAVTPLSPRSQAAQNMPMPMPMPPPLLHTRSGNEHYDRPQTPIGNGFTSPVQTPQGSPSKKQLPPGANDLPNVFDNALKLAPNSPTKQQGFSPGKQGLSAAVGNTNGDPFADQNSHYFGRSESPTRQANKENTPAGDGRFGKDQSHSHAALSRRDQYQPTESRRNVQTRGLTAEELQKLQNPRVKRLANVTQLCMLDSALPS